MRSMFRGLRGNCKLARHNLEPIYPPSTIWSRLGLRGNQFEFDRTSENRL